MTDTRIRVYTSDVRGIPLSLAGAGLSVVLALAVLLAVHATAPTLAIAVAAVAVVAVAFALGTARVRVTATPEEVRIRSGAGAWRSIRADEILALESTRVPAAAIFGGGIPASAATDRRIVRGGDALHLTLRSREELWLSIRGAVPADLIEPAADAAAPDEPRPPASASRPWFGSKRVGYGIRPQTWQGWLVVLVPAAAVVAIAWLVPR